ncbi:MAG TPA: hypothetical protein VLM89_05025 [Phycisphaerae bacterium]|nr:hypothetical protein [Phycisphaerae bacterium]
MAQPGIRNNQVAPVDGLYVTLLIVAAAIEFLAIVFVAARAIQQFDSLWPAGGA